MRIFLAYAPRGVGLRCAVLYQPARHDVYGWFTGHAAHELMSAYFAIGDFYTPLEPRYRAVQDTDLHAGWLQDEALCHALARAQEAFRREWLWYAGDPCERAERARYAEAELACGQVNVRFARLGRFSRLQPNWTYYSPDFEGGVLKCLEARWPLDFADTLEAA